MSLEQEKITKEIIGAAFDVHNELGYGFLEKVYQNAMVIALGDGGLIAESEPELKVYFRNHLVGDYRADLLVENVVVEMKVSPSYNTQYEAQLLNELKAIKCPVGMLINFGREKVELKRFVSSTAVSA